MPRLSPSGKRVRDNCYRGQGPLNKIYTAGRLSLDSVSLGFKKISYFLQFADKFFDLCNRWSADPLNEGGTIRVNFGFRCLHNTTPVRSPSFALETSRG